MTPGPLTCPADETGVTAHLILDHADGPAPELDDVLRIDGPDGHHLQRARRVAVGEELTAADGAGSWRRYRVTGAGRGALDLDAVGSVHTEPAPSYEIIAAPAVVTRNRFDGVIAQLTELGVDAIVPLVSERCVVRWDRRGGDGGDDAMPRRLQAIAREAAMQCRRARLPRVCDPVTPPQIASLHARVVVALRDAPRAMSPTSRPPLGDAIVVVTGPEGGFSAADLDAFGAHDCVRLGNYVLRAETAAVVAAAMFTQRRDARDGSEL